MNAIYITMAILVVAMYAAFGGLWLHEHGIHPIDKVLTRFRRMHPVSRVLALLAVSITIVHGGTKPPSTPSIEKINTIIDAVSSTSVTVHWEYLDIDLDLLQGKRVRVLVNNENTNGWQTVFEGDAATDTSCTFAGFYIADDTKVQIQVDNAIMAVKVSFN